MLKIGNREIERIVIVGDNPEARSAHEYVIEDMGLSTHQVENIQHDNELNFLDSIGRTDAVLCNFLLKQNRYAPYNGDMVISQCFHKGIPGVLYTSIYGAPIRRDYLRYIPGLIRNSNLNPDELRLALKKCEEELLGEPRPSRYPWRALVRVGDVDRECKCFYAIVPAWDTQAKIRIDFDNLPENIKNLVKPDHRFHALVNTGAMDPADLYFDEWEEM